MILFALPCSADISRLVSLTHVVSITPFVVFVSDKGDDGLDCGVVAWLSRIISLAICESAGSLESKSLTWILGAI